MSRIIAFDADVLIYAAAAAHPLGARVAALLAADDTVAVGSVLLLPEVLSKPMRLGPDSSEVAALISVISRLDLHPMSEETARLALALAAGYGLHAADAAHLATAVSAGAIWFVTNNRKDFPKKIAEIEIIYTDDLPAAAAGEPSTDPG